MKYSTIYKIFFFALVLISFNFFRLTPLNDFENLAIFGFSLLGILQFTLYYKRIDISIRKWIWFFTFVAVIAIINSHLKLQQDIVSSIIPNLSFFYIFSALPTYFLLKRIKTHEKTISRYFRFIAWGQLAFFAILFFLNISLTYKSIFTGSALEIGAGKISKLFIQWAIIFYFLKYVKTTNFIYLGISLLFFLLPAIQNVQRMQFLITLFVFTLILFRYRLKPATGITVFILIVGGLVFLAVSGQSISSNDTYVKFTEAFKIFNPDQNINDVSTLARVNQITYALDKIKNNWLTGLGNVRRFTKDEIIGDVYFHISDIGVFGILFVSGILGLIIFILQFYSGIKQKKFLRKGDILSESFFYLLIYLLIFSIGTGNLFFNPVRYLVLIIIIQSMYLKNDERTISTNHTGQLQ